MAFENGIRRLFVLLAVVLVCLQRYFKFVVDDPAFSERTINYAIFFIMLLTFNYQKANSKLILLFILLPIGFFIRRYLPIWILLTIIYQIINLRIPVKTLAYVAFITISCELCIQYYLVTNNIITDVVKQTIKASGRMHTWGMGNGNNLSAFFMQVFMLLYLIMKKRWFVYILLTIVCGYGIYMYTCSRTPYFTIIILCILVLCYHLGLFFKFTKYIIGALPVILFGITVYLSLFDATSNTAELDTVSSGRLTIAAYFFSHMTPLAILIGMDRPENMALDSAYIDMFMQGGVIYLSLFFIVYWTAVIRNFESIKQYLPLLISIAISGLAESTFSTLNAISIIMWVVLIKNLRLTRHGNVKISNIYNNENTFGNLKRDSCRWRNSLL